MPDVNRSRYCSCCKNTARNQISTPGVGEVLDLEWYAAVCPGCDLTSSGSTVDSPPVLEQDGLCNHARDTLDDGTIVPCRDCKEKRDG